MFLIEGSVEGGEYERDHYLQIEHALKGGLKITVVKRNFDGSRWGGDKLVEMEINEEGVRELRAAIAPR